jgi:hypothetical protein
MRAALGVTSGIGVLALAGCGAVSHTRAVRSTLNNGTRPYAVHPTAVVESSNCPALVVCAPVLLRGKPGIGGPRLNQPAHCPPLVLCLEGPGIGGPRLNQPTHCPPLVFCPVEPGIAVPRPSQPTHCPPLVFCPVEPGTAGPRPNQLAPPLVLLP